MKRPASGVPVGQVRVPVEIPPGLQAHLDQWGPRLRSAMALVAASHGLDGRQTGSAELRVGTDCSGAEAPILALRALGIPHRHVFSCEANAKKREYIQENCKDAVVFPDMLTRDHDSLPAHNVYVCGFPCTPFSSLRTNSKLLRDPNAKPFFATLRTIERCLPQLVILENVVGIRQVMAKVWKRLAALRWYEVLTFLIDPADLGEPVRRPRYYFVLVRQDACRARGGKLHRLAAKLAAVGLQPRGVVRLSQRLLPNASPEVQRWLSTLTRRHDEGASATTRGKGPKGRKLKWVARHAQSAHSSSSSGVVGRVVGLSPRQRSLLGILQAQAGGQTDFNTDVSQALGRARPAQVSACPTVTPRGRIVVGELGRLMVPIEKLLVHLFPVHTLQFPRCLTDADLADLGGNTMHLMAAGASVWQSQCSSCACAAGLDKMIALRRCSLCDGIA